VACINRGLFKDPVADIPDRWSVLVEALDTFTPIVTRIHYRRKEESKRSRHLRGIEHCEGSLDEVRDSAIIAGDEDDRKQEENESVRSGNDLFPATLSIGPSVGAHSLPAVFPPSSIRWVKSEPGLRRHNVQPDERG